MDSSGAADRDTDPKDSTRPSQGTSTNARSRKLSRDEQADLELQEFLAGLTSEESVRRPSSRTARFPSSGAAQDVPDDDGSSIAPYHLYPSEMSCRQAFDSAFYCQSMGGQFMNVWRYGQLKNCREHWGAFWFCMRTRGLDDDARRRRVKEFHRQREMKYQTGPSSEDVWTMRTEPVRDAFNQPPSAESTGQSKSCDS